MIEVIGVRFKSAGKIYYFEADNHQAVCGDKVIVETSRGIELGEVMLANFTINPDSVNQPLKKVLRHATSADLKKAENNKKKEAEAFRVCSEKIREHKLDMKLTEVEYAFDGSKLLFYFTADGRIDFRCMLCGICLETLEEFYPCSLEERFVEFKQEGYLTEDSKIEDFPAYKM